MLQTHILSDIIRANREGRSKSIYGAVVKPDTVFSKSDELMEIVTKAANGVPSPIAKLHTWSIIEPTAPLPTHITTIAQYRFDETTGTEAADSSQNDNDLTLSNVTWGTGKFSNCAVFNGTSASGTVVAVSAEPLRSYLYVSAWVNPSSLSGTDPIVKLADRFVLYFSEGELKCQIFDGVATHTVSSGLTASTSAWQFVTLQYIAGEVFLALGDLVYKTTIAMTQWTDIPAWQAYLSITADKTKLPADMPDVGNTFAADIVIDQALAINYEGGVEVFIDGLQADLSDLRVFNADASIELAWGNKQFSQVAGSRKLVLGIGVPGTAPLLSSEDTTYRLYRGCTGGPFENKAGVVPTTDGYVGHWTLEEASGNLADWTTNALTGTRVSSTVTTGQIGSGQTFSGSAQYINLSTAAATLNFSGAATLSWWVKSTNDSVQSLYTLTQGEGGEWTFFIIYLGNGVTGGLTNELITIAKYEGSAAIYGMGYCTPTRTELFDGNWHQVSIIFTGSVTKLYLDGVEKTLTYYNGADTGSYGGLSAVNAAILGARRFNSTWGSYFNGSLDEAFIQNVGRSANWNTTYYNMTSANGDFWTVGDEVAYSVSPFILTVGYDGTNFFDGSIDDLIVEANVRVQDDWPIVTDCSGVNDVLFYPFAENTGTVVGSGNILTPALKLTGGTWTTGRTRYGVSFDGNNDYASVTPTLESFSGRTLSIEVGIKFTVDAVCPILTQTDGINLSYNGAGGIVAALGGVSNPASVLGTIAVDTDEWLNVCLVYDGVNKMLYVNGQKIGQIASTGTAQINTNTLYVARSGSTYGACVLDRIRIYRAMLRPFYRTVNYFMPGQTGTMPNEEWIVR
jgi:hypothetical protein